MKHWALHILNQQTAFIGVYFLNVFTFSLFVALVFTLQHFNIVSSLTFGLALPVTLLFQIICNTVINRKYLQTKKQVVMVNVLLFVTFLILIAAQVIPAFMRLRYCSTIMYSRGEEAARCWTFRENARAYVIYGLAIYYLLFYITLATGLQLLLRTTKNRWIVVSFSLLSMAIMWTLLFRPFSTFQKKPHIQVQPLPKQTAPYPVIELTITPRVDPKVYQLESRQ